MQRLLINFNYKKAYTPAPPGSPFIPLPQQTKRLFIYFTCKKAHTPAPPGSPFTPHPLLTSPIIMILANLFRRNNSKVKEDTL